MKRSHVREFRIVKKKSSHNDGTRPIMPRVKCGLNVIHSLFLSFFFSPLLYKFPHCCISSSRREYQLGTTTQRGVQYYRHASHAINCCTYFPVNTRYNGNKIILRAQYAVGSFQKSSSRSSSSISTVITNKQSSKGRQKVIESFVTSLFALYCVYSCALFFPKFNEYEKGEH